MQTPTRRQFIKTAALTGAATSVFPAILTGAKPADTQVRLGFIGVGARGRNHVEQALFRDDVVIPAICDIDPDSIARTNAIFTKKGKPLPEAYSKGSEAFLQMLKRDDLDGVVIATPWEWHVPMAVATMKAGKYAGVEVSANGQTQGVVGVGRYVRKDRDAVHDSGKCLLPARCTGRVEHDPAGAVWRNDLRPLRLSARFAEHQIQRRQVDCRRWGRVWGQRLLRSPLANPAFGRSKRRPVSHARPSARVAPLARHQPGQTAFCTSPAWQPKAGGCTNM